MSKKKLEQSFSDNYNECTSFFFIVLISAAGSTQPGHPSVGRRNEYQRRLGHKQAGTPRDAPARGLAV